MGNAAWRTGSARARGSKDDPRGQDPLDTLLHTLNLYLDWQLNDQRELPGAHMDFLLNAWNCIGPEQMEEALACYRKRPAETVPEVSVYEGPFHRTFRIDHMGEAQPCQVGTESPGLAPRRTDMDHIPARPKCFSRRRWSISPPRRLSFT
jgi:hypothetical protein